MAFNLREILEIILCPPRGKSRKNPNPCPKTLSTHILGDWK